MIHLFAGGKSSLDYIDKDLEGLKVGLNFAFEATEDIDVLIFCDECVGEAIKKKYKVRPLFDIVCTKANGRMIAGWVTEPLNVSYGAFTVTNALYWLRSRFPNEDIYVYGLDGGDASDYYDKAIKENYNYDQPETKERQRRLGICYSQLEKLPCGTDKIFNMNPNSPCKAFKFATD